MKEIHNNLGTYSGKRIFSQDGSVDLPYSLIAIEANWKTIYAYIGQKQFVIARYPSYTASIAALELMKKEIMLHDSFQFPHEISAG